MENQIEKYKAPVIELDGRSIPFTIQTAHQYAALKARKDILFYGRWLFGHKPAPHHVQWFKEILDPRNNRILIVSSREFGKTMTVVALATWYMGHYPDRTNVLASVAAAQAQKRLDNIKDIISANDTYKHIFPWVKRNPHLSWNSSEFNIVDDRLSYANFRNKRIQQDGGNPPTFYATGMEGKGLIGSRITGLAIVDDPHDQDASFSQTTRERAIEWYFNTFINCLLPTAKSIIITTRWHEMDLAGHIKEFFPGQYKILETPAEWEDEKGIRHSNWAEQWSMDRLMAKEAEIGTRLYRALFCCDVYALAGKTFKIEWLNNQLPEELPDLKYVLISVDPAVTVKKSSDFTAISLCGWDAKFNFYLLGLWNLKLHPRDLGIRLQQIYDQAIRDYKHCERVIIEKAAQQTLISDNLINDTSLPILGVNYHGNKETKANNLAVLASNGKFFANWKETWANALRSQMLSFPNTSGKDDMVDSIAQAANYMLQNGAPVKAKLKVVQSPYLR